MATKLEFGRDINAYNAFAPRPSTTAFSATLTNGAASSITLPGNFQEWVVAFSFQPGTVVWVDFSGATAAIPVGATFAATTSELNPGARKIATYKNDGVTPRTISLITDSATADVSITLYGIEQQ